MADNENYYVAEDGILVHNGYSKTDIGENDLSKAVIKYRIDNKINRGNVAVFEYIDNFGN
ncbi:hypothetical protein [Capnocytophaga canimorsus]|uniref:hypothetical protein n=1 Tax=Capnocytophaga canimorsus TaxID=28188 RepID=UPI001E5BE70D|nr:hypothetical protein [Capnocytophaga canimorsus]